MNYLVHIFLLYSLHVMAMQTQRLRGIQEIQYHYDSELKSSIIESLWVSGFVFGCSNCIPYSPLTFKHKLLAAFCVGNLYGLCNEFAISDDAVQQLKRHMQADNLLLPALQKAPKLKLAVCATVPFLIGAMVAMELNTYKNTDFSNALTCGLIATNLFLMASRYAHAKEQRSNVAILVQKIS